MNRTHRIDSIQRPSADLPPLGKSVPNLVTFIEPTIEQGVPVPGRGGRHGNWTPVFAKMKPGDSFACDHKNIGQLASAYAKKSGRKYATRRIAAGQWRVWRLA
jgi:hypothetical protein